MLKSTLSKRLKFVILGMVLCGTLIYFWGFPTIGHIIIRNYPEFSFCYFPWLIFFVGYRSSLLFCFVLDVEDSKKHRTK